MGIKIPALLEAILEATAAKTGAEARIAGLRKVLDEEARRRYAAEGAAPSWKRRDLGAVRLDEDGAWAATVADPAAFGSYIAQHHPTEANGVVEVPADRLEEALAAIGFAGIDVVDSRVEVRSNFRAKYLEGLIVDVEETHGEDGTVDRAITVVDPATGAIVDGTSGTRSPAKLVVTLDRDLRARVLEQAAAQANEVLAAVLDEDPAEAPTAPAKGREVTLEELLDNGLVRPASELVDSVEDQDAGYISSTAGGKSQALEAEAAKRAGHREPYVGEGAEGARRSAEIDRTEADGLDRWHDVQRIEDLTASAARWDAQAAQLEATEAGRYTGSVGEASDKALLEESPAQEAATLTPYDDDRPGMERVHVTEAGIDAVEAMDNREALRRVARSKGIPAGGTKRELAERLYAAGIRA